MSFDRITPFSGGVNWPGQKQSNNQPPAFSGSSGKAGDVSFGHYAIPATSAVSHSFARDWAVSSATYGTQSLAAEVINRATAPNTKIGQKLNTPSKSALSKMGIGPDASISDTMKTAKGAVTYSDILRLDNRQLPVQNFNLKDFQSTVKSNVSNFTNYFKNNSNERFLKDVTPKSYVRDTVIKSNIQPVKDLLTSNHPEKQFGSGLLRMLGGSLLGLDVLKHTHRAYKTAHAQEDGSIKSQWKTAGHTAKTFGKYSFRDGTSWEMAGIGAAIGKAIIPLAIGGVSLGGIFIGALVGVAAQKLLDKFLHTGRKDPESKEEMNTSHRGGAAQGNHPVTEAIER